MLDRYQRLSGNKLWDAKHEVASFSHYPFVSCFFLQDLVNYLSFLIVRVVFCLLKRCQVTGNMNYTVRSTYRLGSNTFSHIDYMKCYIHETNLVLNLCSLSSLYLQKPLELFCLNFNYFIQLWLLGFKTCPI